MSWVKIIVCGVEAVLAIGAAKVAGGRLAESLSEHRRECMELEDAHDLYDSCEAEDDVINCNDYFIID